MGDGGRTWRRIGASSPQASASGSSTATIAFSSPRRGLVLTEDGLFRTDDGGRTLLPVPTPPQNAPDAAYPVGDGRGLVAEDPDSSNLYRTDGRTGVAAVPRITVRRVGRRTEAPYAERIAEIDGRQVVAGTVRGIPPGSAIAIVPQHVLSGPPGDEATSATVRSDGTFRVLVSLRPRTHALRAWFSGVVLPDRTIPSARSAAIPLPRTTPLRR